MDSKGKRPGTESMFESLFRAEMKKAACPENCLTLNRLAPFIACGKKRNHPVFFVLKTRKHRTLDFRYFFIEIRLADIQSILISDVVLNNSSVAYTTQCSSHHVPSFMLLTQLPHPPTQLPSSHPQLFSVLKSPSWFCSVSDGFPVSFPSFPL